MRHSVCACSLLREEFRNRAILTSYDKLNCCTILPYPLGSYPNLWFINRAQLMVSKMLSGGRAMQVLLQISVMNLELTVVDEY